MLYLKGLDFIPATRHQVSDPATWKPVPNRVSIPTGGITLPAESLFQQALENNAAYLLQSFSVDHILYHFRVRAGQQDAPGGETQVGFWDTNLRGSNAGRFLMGAANTLRWLPNEELRRRMDAVIDGIAACRGADGYIYPFPPEEMLRGMPGTIWGCAQESNYARAWLTHGLIDASIAGNATALPLCRDGHDWFNCCDDLPELNTVAVWMQGHVASTRLYFTPVGQPRDIQVGEAWYVVDEWMDMLLARNLDALWKHGLAWPHCYEITACEAYLDHYRATGDERFLNAMLSAWDMLHTYWVHNGGSIALCEMRDYPPGSYFLAPEKKTGEFCGSVFWVKFNQRLHQLFPAEEKYVAEIEKSIYNVALADQAEGRGIRYHTHLEGQKEAPTCANTCCEGQGTRMLGSLPEFIYSLAEEGVTVNLYEPSTLVAEVQGHEFTLALATTFPFDTQVALRVHTAGENPMRLRLRMPGWATREIPIRINGQQAAIGMPGTFAELFRKWQDGDCVTFSLPIAARLTRYRGADSIEGHFRYALEYGPILLAIVGPLGDDLPVAIPHGPNDLVAWLQPVPDKPLHFTITGLPEHEVMPYWHVPESQTFTCFPVLTGPAEPESECAYSPVQGIEAQV